MENRGCQQSRNNLAGSTELKGSLCCDAGGGYGPTQNQLRRSALEKTAQLGHHRQWPLRRLTPSRPCGRYLNEIGEHILEKVGVRFGCIAQHQSNVGEAARRRPVQCPQDAVSATPQKVNAIDIDACQPAFDQDLETTLTEMRTSCPAGHYENAAAATQRKSFVNLPFGVQSPYLGSSPARTESLERTHRSQSRDAATSTSEHGGVLPYAPDPELAQEPARHQGLPIASSGRIPAHIPLCWQAFSAIITAISTQPHKCFTRTSNRVDMQRRRGRGERQGCGG